MALYLAERYLPGITREQILAAAARARDTAVRMTEEGTAVRYVGSTFIPEDEACFCLFDAASAETVKEANERAAIPFDRIIEAVRVASEDLTSE